MNDIWTSHVTHMNESCHIYEWVMSHTWMSHVTYEWVMSHIWMSHVTHMNESCYIYEWVMSHIWMSRVTHMNVLCHTYERVMSHIWTSHVTHMNESCHTYERVMSPTYERGMPCVWMGHVTHMNKSCVRVRVRDSESCTFVSNDCVRVCLRIDWIWLPIFRTNFVRGPCNKEMKFQNKGALLVQIAPLFISQPRNQNQSILGGSTRNRMRCNTLQHAATRCNTLQPTFAPQTRHLDRWWKHPQSDAPAPLTARLCVAVCCSVV